MLPLKDPGLASESDAVQTIAHELNHVRGVLSTGQPTDERTAEAAAQALARFLPMTTRGDDREFIEVVSAAPFSDADDAFDQWLREHRLLRSDLPDEELRIDTVRSIDGRSLRRYMVRRRSIPQ